MFIIAGLGNPGYKYLDNRHNIGFMAVNAIHSAYDFSPWKKKYSSEISEGKLDGIKTFLLKPQTFMNCSGKAIESLMQFYKLSISNFLIIHDDLDLPSGKVRLKTGGSDGGHNGLKSISSICGNDYKRLRLGISHPGSKELVVQYVLSDFSKDEKTWLYPLLKSISCHIPLLVKKEDSLFLNRLLSPFTPPNTPLLQF
ncbi:Peptidyl-tRNA hydrolase [Liberibacter crescens BT-1]|uniref:Peptidyl-tRNA hydrolase n=2 Tax=Liberibacter crescens TaxID=1273132 RepID=L0EVD5_LIBCB|nr:aminoacyl-tRNA hydrolase [Liberibacter crescens]AGA64613.1 Peptidyl-tRNA hydrolase [Liberibacter crescens BT-1]